MGDRPLHVLVVDDNPDLLGVCSEILEDAGFRVTACASGLTALIRIGLDRPDVAILDIKLGDVSGIDVFRAIRAVPEIADLPALFISGIYLDETMVRNTTGDPEVQLLLKPIPEETLLEGIRTAISRCPGRDLAA
jgi:CheY-like chemotaxis protein